MEYVNIALPLGVAFALTLVGTLIALPLLRKTKAGQNIREEGPKSHLKKAGTPTMGGIAIICGVLIACLSLGELSSDMFIILASFSAFGFLGFLDDFMKISMKRNLGLTAKQKIFLQMLIAVSLAIYQAKVSAYGTNIAIPFVNVYWDLGFFYIPFVAFVAVAMANSVNLTDGLDGLASGVTMIVAMFLALVAGTYRFMDAQLFCSTLSGACLAFLIFNRHPAKIFMGDTGSMALGGGVAAAAIIMNMELIIPIAGGVYVLEALSVILQVLYFKTTGGKRLFKMSPLHHHFELSGWKETKVVAFFWVLTSALCILSLFAI